MGLRCGMRTTKCQLLVTSLCVMLLGLSIATLSTVTHYGLHFTLISNISLESNSYRVIHHAAFYFGICLSMTLILAALLSSAATVQESQCLTAMDGADLKKVAWPCSCRLANRVKFNSFSRAACSPSRLLASLWTIHGFFCFALAFCGLIPAACWRYTHGTEVENSMMDVYDLVYEEVRRNASSFRRHELTAIHEAFLCCGKRSPFGDTANVERKTCPSGQMHDVGQDCLREIQDFLKKHMDFVSMLLGITIGFTARQLGAGSSGSRLQQHLHFIHPGLPARLLLQVRGHVTWRRACRSGLRDDPDFIPLVLHPLQQQPGPERQIHPAREVETRHPSIPTR
ncbi:tetraspanin-32 isoform 3-T3 [Spheniscus humboldti]